MRLWSLMGAAALLLTLGACEPPPEPEPEFDVGEVVDGETLPFNDAPGTRFAPGEGPAPSARGAAPAPSERVRRYAAPDPAPAEPPRRALICDDPRVVGVMIDPIVSEDGICGLENGVSVTAVSGVRLSAPIRTDCETARQLASWAARGVQPQAARLFGRRVAELRPSASYICRSNLADVDAAAHAVGAAVDIAGFTLEDGETMSVLEDWPGTGVRPRFLRAVWRSACDYFSTVLGPQVGAFYNDHIHLGAGSGGVGALCR